MHAGSAFETGNKLSTLPDGRAANKTTIITNSGKLLDLAAPNAEDICLQDIAHGLSQHVRWAGQGRWLTVAQHSLEVVRLLKQDGCGKKVLMSGLLHDAHEAYIGDLSGGLKFLIGGALPGIIENLDKAIEAWAGVSGITDDYEDGIVKTTEDELVLPEFQVLFEGKRPHEVGMEPLLDAEVAESAFIAEANGLGLYC
jgi:hypothetical protein